LNDETRGPNNDISAQRALIQKLIANQYRVVHHSERLITDFAKIASIILGFASIFGLPQILLQDWWIIPISGFTLTLILLSATCVIVIVYAFSKLGGWDVLYEESPSLSLWWYSDKRLQSMKKDETGDKLVRMIAEEILNRTRSEEEDLELKREAGTLALLYARAEEQFAASRRMKWIFVYGVILSLSASLVSIMSYFDPWLPIDIIVLTVLIIGVFVKVIQRYWATKRTEKGI